MDIYSYKDQPTSERQQTVAMRTWTRNIPSQPLQPYLDARPVSTKYSIMPIVDPRKPIEVPLIQRSTYTPETIYNPGNDGGPWSGYASNINNESALKNQVFALQSCPQSTYIPSSTSSLYQVKWQNNNNNNLQQPFPTLFEDQTFTLTNPNPHPDKIGFGLFNNATRQQVRDLTKPTVCN